MIGIDPDPSKVVRRLRRNGLQCVVSGSHVATCWAGRMAGSQPIELIAPNIEAVLSCLMNSGATGDRYKDAQTNLFKYIVCRRGYDVFQIHPRKSPAMKRIWQTRRLIGRNPTIACTGPEASLFMRWLSMTNSLTELVDRMQDVACIYGIIENCPNLLLDELKLLGDLAYPGGGQRLLQVFHDAKAEKQIL